MIKVLLTRPKGFFKPISWLIRLCENTPFSHVCLSWDSHSLQRSLVYEAVGSGVRFLGSKQFLNHVDVVKSFYFPVGEDAKRVMIQFCVDQSGSSYSKCHLIGLGLMRLAKLFGKRIANPFKDGEYSQVCVEAIVRALKEAGLDLGIDAEDSGLIELEVALRNVHFSLNGLES